MNKEFIREKLGLFQQSKIEQLAIEKGIYPRCTGKTTEMLLSALETAATGDRVMLMSRDYHYARDLRHRLLDMANAAKLDIDASKITAGSFASLDELRYKTAGRRRDSIFIDHFSLLQM